MVGFNKSIYYTAVIFMAANWLFTLDCIVAAGYISATYSVSGRDITSSENQMLLVVAVMLFVSQNYLLLIALFTRLSVLFQSTPFPLSKCHSALYVLALSMLPVLFLCIGITRDDHTVRRILLAVFIFTFLSLLMSLMTLFVVKLKQIQKNQTLKAFIRRQVRLSALAAISFVSDSLCLLF